MKFEGEEIYSHAFRGGNWRDLSEQGIESRRFSMHKQDWRMDEEKKKGEERGKL